MEVHERMVIWRKTTVEFVTQKFNSLSPDSDQHQNSPCNINAYSTPEVMTIKDMITQGKFSSYSNKFSPVLLQEEYGDTKGDFVHP